MVNRESRCSSLLLLAYRVNVNRLVIESSDSKGTKKQGKNIIHRAEF